MKSTTFAFGSLLATIATAQPHRHQHQHAHQKRAGSVVWITEWVEEYETIAVTETIWVTSGQIIPLSTAVPTTSVSIASVPAQFFEPQSSSVAPTPTPSSSSVYIAPAPQSTSIAAPFQAASVPEVESPAVVVPATTSSISVTVPTPASTLATVAADAAVAPVASSVAAPVSSVVATSSNNVASTASGSSTASCEGEGALCGGDLTYYDTGLGACGWENDGTVESVVALPFELMGTQSNGNPYCGKTITILRKSKSITAKVVDKCMGCIGRSIDVSHAAFDQLEDEFVGRTTATWYFNE
ncbi:allergen Asp F7 [Calycina marina]|uniref:Allergen Asp F7 n=1 Tax=Calycina marina TaxID=1763456 RepID=A0A9P7Z238_9HELO|nr:allergen Asp F7 [Calycina marina]